MYTIRVTAVNSAGTSAQSSPITITTLQSAPAESPQNSTAVPISSTSILFTCYPPSPGLQNGPIHSFKLIYYSEWNSDTSETESLMVDPSESYPIMMQHRIELPSLQPYTLYTLSVIAVNDAGESPQTVLTARTFLTAPTESPQSVTTTTLSSTSILINLYPPSTTHQNGPIRNYTISYRQGEQVVTSYIHIGALETYPLETSSQITLSSLLPFTEYTFTIVATNVAGSSPSVTVVNATYQAAPGESPQNVTAVPIDSTSILFTCYPPSPNLQNGPIRTYRLAYYSQWNSDAIETVSIMTDTNEPYPTMLHHQIELSALQPYTIYTVTVTAINDAGLSPNVTITARTHSSAPSESPQSVTATTLSSTSILINLYPPSATHQNGPIRNYTILSYRQGEQVMTSYIHIGAMETYPLEMSSQITLSSLLPVTEYMFTILATNDAGSSPGVIVMNTTNPTDAQPVITYPHTDTIISPELSLNYQQEVVCTATGYPIPTIIWYNSENQPVTTGDTLILQTTNVADGRIYVCRAVNEFGEDTGSITISIDTTDISVTTILDGIDDNFDDPSEFDPGQVVPVAILVANILPNISNVPISQINDTKDTLAQSADTIEMLFDVITDNDTAISLDDAGTIVNIAGDIIGKDTELEDISDNPVLSTDAIQMGGIAYASDALIIALRTIEKVCHNLGLNHFDRPHVRDTFTVESMYVDIYGANIPITNQLSDETFPLNEDLDDTVLIPENVMRDLAGDQPSVKVVIASVGLYGAVHSSSAEGTGPKQDSKILVVVIPGRNGTVSLVENGTIIFNSAISNSSTDRIGTFLLGNLWSTNGITTVVNSDTNTSLTVDHFTSFVIFATHPPTSSSLEFYLSIASYVISAASILSLVTSLFLFIFAGKKGFFKTEINILYFNLCIALLISTILFLLYGLKPDVLGLGELLCKILAVIIHYSWIVVFTWCLAFAIYTSYKIKFGHKKNKKIYPYIIIFAWVFPILFPVVTLGIRFSAYVDITKHCFPTTTDYVLMGLLGPILILSVVTILMVICLSIAFVLVRTKLENDVIRANVKHILFSTLAYTCILIAPWIALAVFVFIENSLIEWIYVLLNDTMGIFFLIFIALRVDEVRLLLLCRSPRNTSDVVNNPNAFNNPIYEGNLQTAADNVIYDEVPHKPGADLTYEAMEKYAYEEKGDISKEGMKPYNPYLVHPSTSSYSAQMYESELPPIYDHVAGTQPETAINNPNYDTFRPDATFEIVNPFYQTTTVEGRIEGIYEELNVIGGGNVPSPIHPTGTQMDKEYPEDISNV